MIAIVVAFLGAVAWLLQAAERSLYEMLHMIGHAIFGLIVGLVARFLLPGPNPAGLIVTAILGIAGGWLGGQLGRWFGW
jgi:uncharacterized membrane protein YeaQ/YmgE (transglycosylase-associated protein family)